MKSYILELGLLHLDSLSSSDYKVEVDSSKPKMALSSTSPKRFAQKP